MPLFLSTLISLSGWAAEGELECTAWHQSPGQTHTQIVMPFTGINSVTGDFEYRATLGGSIYRVDWEKAGNTLRASVVFNPKAHVFATAVVPRLEAKDISTLDATRDDGERVSIHCMMK